MRRTSRIVAGGDGAVGAEKGGADVPDPGERGLGVAGVDREVLGGEFVGEVG